MADYSRMKVVELKAELKRLGLPQNGLKAELISRLEEATASEDSQPATSELPAEASTELPDEATTTTAPDQMQPPKEVAPTNELNEVQTEPVAAIYQDSTGTTARAQDSSMTASEAPSLTTTEVVQDAQKRKRRSTTPLAFDEVARKRLRQDGSEAAGAALDSAISRQGTPESKHEAATDQALIDDIGMESAEDEEHTGRQLELSEREDSTAGESANAVDVNEETRLEEASAMTTERNHSRLDDAEDSAMADAGASSPPRGVYSAANDALREETRDPKQSPSPERDIEPSTHPATCALYIKNFMRPLRPQAVREHLLELATPANSPFDPSVVVNFYLDTIRTHAFAVFASTAAASRVRAALHNRVWPDETNRKALWVDFMPPDLFEDWVDVEQQARSKGNMPRYEVAYQCDDDGKVVATLQEMDGNQATRQGPIPRAPRPERQPLIPTGPSRPSGIENAPTGPRNPYSHNGPAMHPSRQDQLDSGFIRTKSSPFILYRPVPPELAQRRLHALAEAKDPYYNEESGRDYHRYYFERDDVLVNRGPEIFLGIRPPHREKERRELVRSGRNPRDFNLQSRRGPLRRPGGGGNRRKRRGPRPAGVPRGGDRFRPSSSYDRSAPDDRRSSRHDSYGESSHYNDSYRY